MNSYNSYAPINLENDFHPFGLGISRLFDFSGILNRTGKMTPKEVDLEAIKRDWQIIGKDIYLTIGHYEEKSK